jgi:hypothetical protein
MVAVALKSLAWAQLIDTKEDRDHHHHHHQSSIERRENSATAFKTTGYKFIHTVFWSWANASSARFDFIKAQ